MSRAERRAQQVELEREVYMPSPRVIAEKCARIRRTWSDNELTSRIADRRHLGRVVEVREVRVHVDQ
jgi:hypothetical protein